MTDVLRSAAASIRSYFGCDSGAFSVLDQGSGRLQKVMLDFPGGKGLMDQVEYAELAAANFERQHKRRAESWSLEEFDKLPLGLSATEGGIDEVLSLRFSEHRE